MIPSAPRIYTDGRDLFLEFPGSPPTILRFAFTEAGLHKALKHIPKILLAGKVVTGSGNVSDRSVSANGKIARISPATRRKREAAAFPAEGKAAALALVRKRNLQ